MLGLIDFFRGKKEKREIPSADFLSLLSNHDYITKEQALSVPSLSSAINVIANTVAMIPVKLYRKNDGEVEEIENDERVELLNRNPGDSLDAFQMKKSVIIDYLLEGNGYIYIKRSRNKVQSLHYVDCADVSVNKNFHPIFKDADFLVQGETYRDFDFIKILKDTKDGFSGTGALQEHNDSISVAYNTILFEKLLVKGGGNKKGVLQSKKVLGDKEFNDLKEKWKKLYTNSSETFMILNSGLEFKELSNTSVEMQLAENKKVNTKEMAAIFNISEKMLTGEVTSSEYSSFIKTSIMPILKLIETALNKELLLHKEQSSFYFAFDTKEIMKADMKERFEAYAVAVREGIMQVDEIRYIEDLQPLGLNFIKLGLQDVLYDTEKQVVYTPNTNKSQKIDELGGETENEDRN